MAIKKLFVKTKIKKITSWANAGVKLHSQVHFGSKKVLGQKYLIPKKFGSKKLGGQQILDLKKIWVEKS